MRGTCNTCNMPCRPQDNYCFDCRIRLDRVESSSELIRGVRFYQIKTEQGYDMLDQVAYWEVYLQGAFGVTWIERDMKFQCKMTFVNNKGNDLFDCVERQHGCGIYVLKDIGHSMMGRTKDVMAYVVAWGQVIEYDRGYRASNVRIERIVLAPELQHMTQLCNKLRERYQVPVDCKQPHLVEKSRTFVQSGQPYYYWR